MQTYGSWIAKVDLKEVVELGIKEVTQGGMLALRNLLRNWLCLRELLIERVDRHTSSITRIAGTSYTEDGTIARPTTLERRHLPER
jgi:hypothetical protein